MNRFVVLNHPWTRTTGGVRVLHYLAMLLHACGYDVAVSNSCYYDPDIPVVSRCGEEDIAIYPDANPGNPLNASRIVRYMLYFASRSETKHIPKSECCIVYHEDYLSDVSAICQTPLFNSDVITIPNVEGWDFYPEEKTIENAVYTGKRNCNFIPNISHVLLRSAPESSCPDNEKLRANTLFVLRHARNFYTLDHNTAMCIEAYLCKCNVFIVKGPDEFQLYDPSGQEKMIMNPALDVVTANQFASKALFFFKS